MEINSIVFKLKLALKYNKKYDHKYRHVRPTQDVKYVRRAE